MQIVPARPTACSIRVSLLLIALVWLTPLAWAQGEGGGAGATTSQPAVDSPTSTEAVTLNTDHGFFVINAEVARTPAQREKGLMNRDELPEDRGMLFLWEEPLPVTMWMRNTRLSLDMIFIKPSGVVHRIVSNTVPYSEDLISSRGDVLAVLEVQGGLAERIGLRPGHRIHHHAFRQHQ